MGRCRGWFTLVAEQLSTSLLAWLDFHVFHPGSLRLEPGHPFPVQSQETAGPLGPLLR